MRKGDNMKRLFFTLLVILGMNLFAENNVSISTKSDKIIATIKLKESEYIILNHDFLFLYVESDHYNFIFSGYPDGELHDDGEIYYSKEVTLEGDLTLKEGIEPGDYNINVIFGFQTCDVEGLCNIPIEVSELILVKPATSNLVLIIISGFIALLCLVLIIVIKRKKA